MSEAYSRLRFILSERGISPESLRQQLRAQGDEISERTIARLLDPDRPVKHVQLRVIGAICRVLGIELGDLFGFAPALAGSLRELPPSERERLQHLLEMHAEGQLEPDRLPELRALVDEANRLEVRNLQLLLEHRERLQYPTSPPPHVAAD